MFRERKAGIRRNSGFSLNVMTDDEANEIHLATLEVLKETGVFVESGRRRLPGRPQNKNR